MDRAALPLEPGDIEIHAEITASSLLVGHVRHRHAPDRVPVLEVWADDLCLGAVRPDLAAADPQAHGFRFLLPPTLWRCEPLPRLELRLANTDAVLLGLPLPTALSRPAAVDPPGEVRWDGGLRLLGVVPSSGTGIAASVHCYEGPVEIAVEMEQRFRLDPGYPFGVDAFEATLPASIADGLPHVIRVVDAQARPLAGSPVTVVAHPDGFRAVLAAGADAARDAAVDLLGRLMDRMLPGSLPFSAYVEWAGCYAAPVTVSHGRGLMVVSTGGGGPVPRAAQELAGTTLTRTVVGDATSPLAISRSDWETLARAVDAAAPDLVLFTPGGGEPTPALGALLAAIDQARTCLVYGDVDLLAADGSVQPLLLPAFDRTRWLRQAYALHAWAVSPDVLQKLAAQAPPTLPAALITALNLLDASDDAHIVHVPQSVARVPRLDLQAASEALADHHRTVSRLSRAGVEALSGAQSLPAVRLHRRSVRLATDIIVPTRDRLDLLQPCVDTLLTLTPPGEWQVTVVDNGSRDAPTLAYLRRLEDAGHIRVLSHPGPFNFARINNHAVACASAPLVCFLNNDTEVLDGDWLDEMRSFLDDPYVAAVGARLLTPDGMVQHGGVVIGSRFAAAHAYDNAFATDAGFADGLAVAREVSALTAACLVVRRQDFNTVGGFDERAFPVNFNDVDLCLKLRAMGRRLVWTPHATLLHHESVSRGLDDTPAKQRRLMAELAALRSRWGSALLADPYYHPCLNLNAHPFSGLAMPPRSREVRITRLRTTRAPPAS